MALCFSQPFLRGKLPFYGNTIASSVLWRLVWRQADRRCDEFWISGCCPSYRGAQLIRLLAEVGKRKKEKGQRELSFPLFPFICPLSGARFLIFARYDHEPSAHNQG